MIGLVLTTATAGNATAAMEAVNANRYSRALCASQLFDCEAAAADPRMVRRTRAVWDWYLVGKRNADPPLRRTAPRC